MKKQCSLAVWLAALAVVCCLCMAQPAFAGTIVGWGRMAVNGSGLVVEEKPLEDLNQLYLKLSAGYGGR